MAESIDIAGGVSDEFSNSLNTSDLVEILADNSLSPEEKKRKYKSHLLSLGLSSGLQVIGSMVPGFSEIGAYVGETVGSVLGDILGKYF